MKNIYFPSLEKLQFVAKEFGAEDIEVGTVGEASFYILNTLNKGAQEEYGEYLYQSPYKVVEDALKRYRIEKRVFEKIMREYCSDIIYARENFKGGYTVNEWLAKVKCIARICELFPDEIIFKYHVKTVDK